MKTYLFIGGVADGKHIALPNSPPALIHRVPSCDRKALAFPDLPACEQPVPVTVNAYRREHFNLIDRVFFIYVADGIYTHTAFDMLIEGYKKP